MDYNYKIEEFDFSLNFLLPFLVSLLLFFLFTIIFESLSNLNYLQINLITYGLILLFFAEGILSSFLRNGINLPKYLMIIEMAIFGGLLKVFYSGTDIFGFWIICGIVLLIWLTINKISNYFFYFRIDYKKIMAGDFRGENWNIQLVKTLEYPSAWKKILQNIKVMDFFLLLIWLLSGFFHVVSSITLIITGIFLIVEFILISNLFYKKKELDWYLEGIDISPDIKRYWQQALVIVLLVIFILSAILPVNYSAISFSEISQWLNSRIDNFSGGISYTPPDRKGVNFNRDMGEIADQKNVPSWISYLFLAVIGGLGLLVIALIIGFLISLIVDDLKKTKGITGFFAGIYIIFKKMINQILSQIRVQVNKGLLKRNIQKIKQKRENRLEERNKLKQLKIKKLPVEFKAMVRTVYQAMLKLLALKVNKRGSSQTPFEYYLNISDKLPSISRELKVITDIYVEVIYSQHSFKENLAYKIKRNWNELKKKI